MEDREGAVRVPPDLDRGLDEVMPDQAVRELQSQPLEGDRVVTGNDALLLDAQDLGQLLRVGGDRSGRACRSDNARDAHSDGIKSAVAVNGTRFADRIRIGRFVRCPTVDPPLHRPFLHETCQRASDGCR